MSSTRRTLDTTSQITLDLLALPALNFIAAGFSWKANQDSRGTDNKEAIKHDASNAVSAIVIFSLLHVIARTLRAITHDWSRLSNKDRLICSLFLLLAVGGFAYAIGQIALDNTNTVFFGKGLPAAGGTLFAGTANTIARLRRTPKEELEEHTNERRALI